MMKPRMLLLAVFTACLSPAALASSFDGFEWSFNVTTYDRQEYDDQSGYWLRNPGIISYLPKLTGDLRKLPGFAPLKEAFASRGVARIHLRAQTIATDSAIGPYPFTLMLKNTHGTPEPEDDDFVYFMGETTPQPGEGWKTYTFEVPSQYSGYLPAGWTGGRYDDFEHFRPGADWNTVLDNVDVVQFWWGDPRMYYFVQNWDVGVDDIAVITADDLPPL